MTGDQYSETAVQITDRKEVAVTATEPENTNGSIHSVFYLPTDAQ
jgi:hypothetical protein